jgi:hypothetical protein
VRAGTPTLAGSDCLVDGKLITADLAGPLGGLRILGVGDDGLVFAREDVLTTTPFEVLLSVEWYEEARLVGSALVPLSGQAVPVAPGITVTNEGRALMLRAEADAVRVVELMPQGERITAVAP